MRGHSSVSATCYVPFGDGWIFPGFQDSHDSCSSPKLRDLVGDQAAVEHIL